MGRTQVAIPNSNEKKESLMDYMELDIPQETDVSSLDDLLNEGIELLDEAEEEEESSTYRRCGC